MQQCFHFKYKKKFCHSKFEDFFFACLKTKKSENVYHIVRNIAQLSGQKKQFGYFRWEESNLKDILQEKA